MKNTVVIDWKIEMNGFEDLTQNEQSTVLDRIIRDIQQGFTDGAIGIEIDEKEPTQFERIEKFLSGGLELLTSNFFETDLQSDNLILDDNFAIRFTTDLDLEGRFIWVELLGKFDDDYFYDSVLGGMSLDSLTGLDDMCNHILKSIEQLRQLEAMESEKE